MKPTQQKRFDQLDAKLAQLLKILKKYSDDDLNWKPGEQQWSVMQVLQHLMMAEGYAHQYLQKKLSFNPNLKKTGLLTAVKRSSVRVVMNLPLKINAPQAVNEALPEHSSFWDVAKLWKQQRLDLRAYLNELPQDILNREVYKHPMVGRLGVSGMLVFFDAHFNRHQKQIDRILRNYRY